jgi:hypothetical protein
MHFTSSFPFAMLGGRETHHADLTFITRYDHGSFYQFKFQLLMNQGELNIGGGP